MALVFADRVLETTTTTGTGALTLAGAIAGFRAFSAVLTSPSDTCYYTIFAVDANGNPSGDWETGLGTYSGANTLTRTTPSAGSAATPVSFAAGTKRVGIVPVASGPPFSWVGSDGLAALTTPTDGDISLGTNCALTISQNGGTLRFACTSAFTNIQSYGGLPLRINPAGNSIALGGDTSVTGAISATLGRIPNIQSVTSAATVTPTFADDMVKITAQAAGLTLANPTGTATEGNRLIIRIKDNGTARSIGYGTQYRAIGVTLPTTTVVNKTLYLGLIFNNTDTKWDVVAVSQEA